MAPSPTPSAQGAPDPHLLGPGTAPTPFTAEEIRLASPPGRTAVLVVADATGSRHHRMSRFVDCDADGATFERGACTPEGQPVGTLDARRVSWLDLQAHASFPADAVTIDTDAVDLPLGHLDCLRYTVTDTSGDTSGDTSTDTDTDTDTPAITTFWFATSLPGMPVKVVTTMAGRVVETTEMVANLLP